MLVGCGPGIFDYDHPQSRSQGSDFSESEGTPRKCPADPDNLFLAIKECPWGPEEETIALG